MRKCNNGHPTIYYDVYLDDKPTICPICQLLEAQSHVLDRTIDLLKDMKRK